MPADRLQLGDDGRDVVELPDFLERAHGQSIASDRQPHRLAEVAEVGVDVVLVRTQHDHLAGLVGGHQQRDAELIEEGGEVGGMDAAERRRRAGLSGSRWPASSIAAVLAVG